MNMIDFLILLVLFVSAAFAVYRGFVASALGLAACLLSLAAAFLAGPRLAAALSQNQGLTELLATYTDAGSLVGDYSLSITKVNTISKLAVEAVLKSVGLPAMMQSILQSNLTAAAFSQAGLTTVNQYVSATIVQVILRIGCFVLCFFLCTLALHALINLFNHVFYFSMLRHLDTPAAILCGLLRGIMMLYILFLLIPLVRTVIPLDLAEQYINESVFSGLLTSEKLFLRIAAGG